MLCDDCKNKEACRFYIASFENVNHPLNDPNYRDAFYCDEHCVDKTPLTNGDRTRAMSDYELAEWVVFQTGYQESACSEVTYYNILTGNDDTREGAEKAMCTWLKQPVEEET